MVQSTHGWMRSILIPFQIKEDQHFDTRQVAEEPEEVVQRREVKVGQCQLAIWPGECGDGGWSAPVKRSERELDLIVVGISHIEPISNIEPVELVGGDEGHESSQAVVPGPRISRRIVLHVQPPDELDNGRKASAAWANHQSSEPHCAPLRLDRDFSRVHHWPASLRPIYTYERAGP